MQVYKTNSSLLYHKITNILICTTIIIIVTIITFRVRSSNVTCNISNKGKGKLLH